MDTSTLIDGTGYQAGDMGLAVLITLSAILTYGRIGFEAPAMRWMMPRMAMAVGFSMWAFRFWITIGIGEDVMVAPVSMLSIALITGGYCVVQIRAIRRAIRDRWHPIYCFKDPKQPCQREDRIRAAMKDH